MPPQSAWGPGSWRSPQESDRQRCELRPPTTHSTAPSSVSVSPSYATGNPYLGLLSGGRGSMRVESTFKVTSHNVLEINLGFLENEQIDTDKASMLTHLDPRSRPSRSAPQQPEGACEHLSQAPSRSHFFTTILQKKARVWRNLGSDPKSDVKNFMITSQNPEQCSIKFNRKVMSKKLLRN